MAPVAATGVDISHLNVGCLLDRVPMLPVHPDDSGSQVLAVVVRHVSLPLFLDQKIPCHARDVVPLDSSLLPYLEEEYLGSKK